MRNIIIGLSVAGSIAAFLTSQPAPAHAEPAPLACVVYEDASFICGTVRDGASETDGYAIIDLRKPFITGCVPTEDPNPACQ